MPPKSPTALDRLRQENPGSLGETSIICGCCDELCEPLHDGELLVTVECANVGKDLNAHIVAVAVQVCKGPGRHLMHERSRILAKHRDIGHLFDLSYNGSCIYIQLVRVRECTGCGIDVDHGHCGQ